MDADSPRLSGCANFAVWLIITLISIALFPLGLAIWGVLGLTLGELPIVWNRKIFGTAARVLGGILLFGALGGLVYFGLGCLALLICILAGMVVLLAAKPAAAKTERFQVPSVPLNQSTAFLTAGSSSAEWKYSLDGKSLVYLGRGVGNQVHLPNDPAADDRHAVIYVENGYYYINNLSQKGTRLNGQSITKQMLSNGSTIQIGSTLIVFHESRL